MRCTARVLLALVAGCQGSGVVLESQEWPEYTARHITHHTANGTDELHGAKWERRTTRRERFREQRTDDGVERTYEQYEVVERMTVDGVRNETAIGSPLVGEAVLLVKDGNVWIAESEAARDLVGEHTRFGPPRLRTKRDGSWEIEDGPLLQFLGLGGFVTGKLGAERVERDRIELNIEEEYARAKVTGRGWLLFDFGAGLVTRMELSGTITRKDGSTEQYRTTRTWAPVSK